MAARRAAAPASSALILDAAFSAGEAFEFGSFSFASSAAVGTGGHNWPTRPPVIRVSGLVMLLSSCPNVELQQRSRQAWQFSLVMPSRFQIVGTGGVAAGAAAAGAPGAA